MKKIYPLTIASLFIFISCNINEDKLPEKEVSSVKSIALLSDSSYILSAEQMVFDSTKLFILDEKRAQVLVLDEKLNLLYSIGNRGRGPGEFIPSSFIVNGHDTVIVNDAGNNRLQLYQDKGEYISSISLKETSTRLINGFFYSQQMLIATSMGKKAIRMCFFDDRNELEYSKEFGMRYEFQNDFQNIIRNDRFIHKINSNIIVISDNMPIMDLYDVSGKLLASYDYSQIDLVKEQLNYIESSSMSNENSYRRLVNSTYVSNDYVYILLNRYLPEFTRNVIIRFNFNKPIKPDMLYYLPNKIYNSFSVNKINIYAYDYLEGNLHVFEI